MPEPTADPRALQLAKARQQVGHEPYGTVAVWSSLRPDEQQLLIEEANTWLRAAIAAGIVSPAAEKQTPVEACGKCKKPFGPADRRVRRAGQQETAYCRGCVDFCNDTEIADHRCVICA